GSPGSAVFPDSKQPIDLRTYVQRHGGNFPKESWLVVMFGDSVNTAHRAVWEKIRTDQGTTAQGEIVADGIAATIEDYVISIQANVRAILGRGRFRSRGGLSPTLSQHMRRQRASPGQRDGSRDLARSSSAPCRGLPASVCIDSGLERAFTRGVSTRSGGGGN